MPKDDWVYVSRMLDIANKCITITTGLDRQSYDGNEIYELLQLT